MLLYLSRQGRRGQTPEARVQPEKMHTPKWRISIETSTLKTYQLLTESLRIDRDYRPVNVALPKAGQPISESSPNKKKPYAEVAERRRRVSQRTDRGHSTGPVVFSAKLIRPLRPLRTVFQMKSLRSCDNSLSYKTPLEPIRKPLAGARCRIAMEERGRPAAIVAGFVLLPPAKPRCASSRWGYRPGYSSVARLAGSVFALPLACARPSFGLYYLLYLHLILRTNHAPTLDLSIMHLSADIGISELRRGYRSADLFAACLLSPVFRSRHG